MTEENLTQEVKETECKCFCKSEGVKKFVIVALGTFVGVYAALSLFAAVHRPPMPPCGPCMRPPIHHQYGGDMGRFKGPRGDFQKKMVRPDFNRGELPQRPEPKVQ